MNRFPCAILQFDTLLLLLVMDVLHHAPQVYVNFRLVVPALRAQQDVCHLAVKLGTTVHFFLANLAVKKTVLQ
jgi:hypothetical protein